MGLIERFFEKIKKIGETESPGDGRIGQFMPTSKVPIEDKFLINFKENGGKFLYSANINDARSNFQGILEENNWLEAYCKDEMLKDIFSKSEVKFSNALKAPFGLISCEFLIADTGAILISSNQIGEKKLWELPDNLVIFANITQLVNTVSDGLQNINLRKQKIPSNITTIKNFSTSQNQSSHFMNYGSVAKNLYLILLEDF